MFYSLFSNFYALFRFRERTLPAIVTESATLIVDGNPDLRVIWIPETATTAFSHNQLLASLLLQTLPEQAVEPITQMR